MTNLVRERVKRIDYSEQNAIKPRSELDRQHCPKDSDWDAPFVRRTCQIVDRESDERPSQTPPPTKIGEPTKRAPVLKHDGGNERPDNTGDNCYNHGLHIA